MRDEESASSMAWKDEELVSPMEGIDEELAVFTAGMGGDPACLLWSKFSVSENEISSEKAEATEDEFGKSRYSSVFLRDPPCSFCPLILSFGSRGSYSPTIVARGMMADSAQRSGDKGSEPFDIRFSEETR